MFSNVLAAWPVGVLSTFSAISQHADEAVDEGRRIDSVPIVFALDGETLYSPVDGKPKSGRELERVRNLAHNDRYTLLLQHYDEDWQALWWLRVTGRAAVVAADDHPSAVAALKAKYHQYERIDVVIGDGQLLQLVIEHENAWAFKGTDWLIERFR